MQHTITKISTATVYTTVACTDLAHAERFYRDTLGFDVEPIAGVSGMSMVKCGQGTGLTLYERPTLPNCDTTIATFLVPDLGAAMEDLRAHGVMFEDYDLPYLKTVSGIATQGTSRSAWFKDPFGNVLSLAQM